MKTIKKLIACAVALACVVVPINNYTAYSDITAVGEEAETPIWDGTADISWYDDDETEFHIYTAEELAGFSKLISNKKDMTGKTIYLESDIVLNDVSNFFNWKEEPPENEWASTLDFNGTFEGNGNTITGLYGNNFIYNLKENGIVNNVNIDFSHTKNGGMCVSVYGIVSNCSYDGFVSSETGYAGGICQYLYGTIKNCKNNAIIQSYHYYDYKKEQFNQNIFAHAGGICGLNSGSIINCFNTSSNISTKITHNNPYYTHNIIHEQGAICGSSSGTIENCYNLGEGLSISNGGTIINTYNVGGNISSCSYNMSNCYYLSGSADSDGRNAKAKSKSNMQSEAFVKELGNTFVYVEGEYPKLFWELGYPDPNEPEVPTTEPEPLVVEINKDLIICKETGNYGSIYVKNITENIQFKSADTDIVKVINSNLYVVGKGTTVVYAYDSKKNYYECLVVFEGDINVDGKTNIADAVFLQNYLLGAENFSDSRQYRIADMNQDGSTDVFDMIFMRKLLVSKLIAS